MKLRVALLIQTTLSLSAAAQMPPPQLPALPQLPRLMVGAPAPTLSPARWVKGTPVRLLGHGQVTVIEFFASWCPTCRETFAHVGQLAQKYRGKAVFVGVSVWEKPEDVRDGSYGPKVRAFATSLGAEMPYSVAVDDPSSDLAANWLGATSYDIPKAFIVDRRGNIAWSGHPLADLDDALSAVVSGRFDMAHAMAEASAQVVAVHELVDLVAPIQEAVRAQNFANALSAINAALQKKPALEAGFGPTKFQMLLRTDEPAAYAYARELAAGSCKDSAPVLNLVAWTIVDDDSHLKNPDYATALSLAKQAFDLADHHDACIADTLAYALFKTGEKEKALQLELKAVRMAEKSEGIDPMTLKEIRARLALFKRSAARP